MKRPSFQFYPGDWSANPNLKRCTFAERGVWLEVICLMHDQPEYGVLRWPLKDIAQAVGCKVAELQSLKRKGVLKGDDANLTEAFIYVPRSGRKDGDPVTLIDAQQGPIWFSSRMVKDEYVRTIRGESSRFGAGNDDAPKPTFGEDIGVGQGDGSSSSSSSSYTSCSPSDLGCSVSFARFWEAWPKNDRKQDKAKCLAKWRKERLSQHIEAILADIEAKGRTEKWRGGYVEAPLVYLNGRRWEDGASEATADPESAFAGAV